MTDSYTTYTADAERHEAWDARYIYIYTCMRRATLLTTKLGPVTPWLIESASSQDAGELRTISDALSASELRLRTLLDSQGVLAHLPEPFPDSMDVDDEKVAHLAAGLVTAEDPWLAQLETDLATTQEALDQLIRLVSQSRELLPDDLATELSRLTDSYFLPLQAAYFTSLTATPPPAAVAGFAADAGATAPAPGADESSQPPAATGPATGARLDKGKEKDDDPDGQDTASAAPTPKLPIAGGQENPYRGHLSDDYIDQLILANADELAATPDGAFAEYWLIERPNRARAVVIRRAGSHGAELLQAAQMTATMGRRTDPGRILAGAAGGGPLERLRSANPFAGRALTVVDCPSGAWRAAVEAALNDATSAKDTWEYVSASDEAGSRSSVDPSVLEPAFVPLTDTQIDRFVEGNRAALKATPNGDYAEYYLVARSDGTASVVMVTKDTDDEYLRAANNMAVNSLEPGRIYVTKGDLLNRFRRHSPFSRGILLVTPPRDAWWKTAITQALDAVSAKEVQWTQAVHEPVTVPASGNDEATDTDTDDESGGGEGSSGTSGASSRDTQIDLLLAANGEVLRNMNHRESVRVYVVDHRGSRHAVIRSADAPMLDVLEDAHYDATGTTKPGWIHRGATVGRLDRLRPGRTSRRGGFAVECDENWLATVQQVVRDLGERVAYFRNSTEPAAKAWFEANT